MSNRARYPGTPATCSQCEEEFQPSLNQRRLIENQEAVCCSRACAEERRTKLHSTSCKRCHRPFLVSWGDGFHDYLWDIENNNYCSLTCLYDYLIEKQQLSLPPVAGARIRPLALLTDRDGISDRAVVSMPQQLLFERLLETIDGNWVLEYPITTGLYQSNRRKRYRLDLAYPDIKLAIECDSPDHLRRETQISDTVRDMALAELGWVSIRLTYHDIQTRMEWCIDQVAAAVLRTEEGRKYLAEHYRRRAEAKWAQAEGRALPTSTE